MKTKRVFPIRIISALFVIAFSGWNSASSQIINSIATYGFTFDIQPQMSAFDPLSTYTWNIPTLPPYMGFNPPAMVINQAGVYMVSVTAVSQQGQVTVDSEAMLIEEPAFPFELTGQNGTQVMIHTTFPHLPNLSYQLSYNGGVTFVTIPMSGNATITVPDFGTYDLCLSVYNPLGNQVGLSTCLVTDIFQFCVSPLFVGFNLTAPSSIQCGSPAGMCLTLTGTGDPSDYCVTYNWDDGSVSENVGLDVCPVHFYECSGTYEVTVSIHCCEYPFGLPKILTRTVVVSCDCQSPPANQLELFTVTGGANCGYVGACFYVQNGGTYDELGGYCVTWDWGDGSADTESIVFSCPTHTYECNGTFTITATVFCCYNPCETAVYHKDVNINCPCDNDLGITAMTFSVQDCTVHSTFFGGCAEHCMDWEWGDGSTTSGNDLTHTYHASGTYTIELTVYCCDNPSEFKKFYHEVTVVCACSPVNLSNFPVYDVNVSVAVEPLCKTVLASLDYPPGISVTQYCVRWLWGDGSQPTNTSLGEVPFHNYGSNGSYTVCARILCCDQPGNSYDLGCQDVTIDCQSDFYPGCEVFPSFYVYQDMQGLSYIQPTTQFGGATQQGTQSIVITDMNDMVVGQYSCTADWWEPDLVPPLPDGMYSITMFSSGMLNNETCNASVMEPLEIDHVCPGDLDGNNYINTSDLLLFMSEYGSSCY